MIGRISLIQEAADYAAGRIPSTELSERHIEALKDLTREIAEEIRADGAERRLQNVHPHFRGLLATFAGVQRG